MSKVVRVTLTHRGVRFVELFPVCNEAAREIVESASSKEEAFTEQETYKLEGNQLEFIFGNDDNSVDLVVHEFDEEEWEYGDEIMSEEDYDLWSSDLDDYIEKMKEEETDLVLLEECDHALFGALNDALKAVVEKKTNARDFILEAMRKGLVRASNYYAISDEDEAEKKPHYGVVCAEQMEEDDFSVSYNIELDDDEEFDPDSLEFIRVDCEGSGVSPVIQDKIGLGAALLNVALYDGKVYYAGHDDCMEFGGSVEPEESDFDIINMDLSSKES